MKLKQAVPTRLPRVVRVRYDQNRLWVVCSNGQCYGVPLAHYPWLLNNRVGRSVEFLATGLYWPAAGEWLSVQELLADPDLQPAPGGWWTRCKRRLIIVLEYFEAHWLRHTFPSVCQWLAFSSWWCETWQTEQG